MKLFATIDVSLTRTSLCSIFAFLTGETASIVFNNEIITFRRFGRCYEFWDPSGAESYIPFWESLYKNVSFNVLIYVIDARKYWNKDERVHQVVQDRMEVHNLLCADEFAKSQVGSRSQSETEKDILINDIKALL